MSALAPSRERGGEHWTLHEAGQAALRAACDALLAANESTMETVYRLSAAELELVAHAPGELGRRFRESLARATMPTVGVNNALRQALVVALDPDDEWDQLGSEERAECRERLVDFFEMLAAMNPGRARSLLRRWLKEADLDLGFPEVGDCPRCGEATSEEGFVAGNSPTAPTYDARVCPYCGWTDADEVLWDFYKRR